MNNKIISSIIIIAFVVTISTVFITVANAKSLDFLCFKKPNIIVTLKNTSDIYVSKKEILKIPQVKITNIKYREKEWSKMVNKMDLPNMENPFKNEFTVKIEKNANINEIYNKIKDMDFVENVQYITNTKCVNKDEL